MKNITISTAYAKAIVFGADRRGVDPEQLLIKSGIDPTLLSEPKARIGAEKFVLLYQHAWRDMDDEFLGRTSAPSKVGCFHLASSLAVHSCNLEEVIRVYIRYFRLFSDDLTLALEVGADEVELSLTHLKPDADPDSFLVEWLLVVLYRILSWFIGEKLVIIRAGFIHEIPENPSEYRYTFPCKVDFNQRKNSIFFSKESLTSPVSKNRDDLDRFIKNSPRGLLIWEDKDNSLSSRVRNLLRSNDQDGLPKLDWIARELNTTSYTLSRKLSAEGVPYQQLKDNYRRDKAILLLTQQNISISDISEKLGFTEPSVFSRAFKAWTGLSPLVYRKNKP